jgi:hypothetical protein
MLLKKYLFLFLLPVLLLSSCTYIDKKTQEAMDKEQGLLSKYLSKKSSVLKQDLGEPDKIVPESPYKIYVYDKKQFIINCKREFYINAKTDIVEKFTSSNCR